MPETAHQLSTDPGFLLSRVGAAIRAGFHKVLSQWGIRPQQYQVLLSLAASDGLSQQELCAATRVDSGNMVELLDGLEALGHARRARDPRDRRRHIVTITPAGRSALADLRPAIGDYNDDFFSPLTTAEREQLAGLLGRLFATTDEGRPAGATAPGAPAR